MNERVRFAIMLQGYFENQGISQPAMLYMTFIFHMQVIITPVVVINR